MILIHAWAKGIEGKENPKNYPYWEELVKELLNRGKNVIQVGVSGERQVAPEFLTDLPFSQLESLIRSCDMFISVDSFFQHLAWANKKRGIVLFSQSDPSIFGHEENINLFVDRKFFRKNQFATWAEATYIKEAFVPVDKVLSFIP